MFSKLYIPLIAVLGGLFAFAALSYLLAFGNLQLVDSSGPVVFFQQGTVTSFDAASNPVGTVAIFRVDSQKGIARKIYDDRIEQMLPGQGIRLTKISIEIARYFTDPQLSADSNNRVEKTKLSLTGNVLSQKIERADDQVLENPLSSTVTSADGRFHASGKQVCLVESDEGPCPSTFKVTITDNDSNKQREFDATSFGFRDLRNLYVKVVGFTFGDRLVIVDVYWGGEPGQGKIALVDVVSGTITDLYLNDVPELYQSNSHYYRSVHMSPDRQKLYVNKVMLLNGGFQLLERNLEDGSERLIYDSPEYVEFGFSDDGKTVVVNGGYNGGAQEVDLISGTTKELLPVNTNYVARSSNGRYVVYRVYSTSNGLGPDQLFLLDVATGKKRLVYDQKVVAQSGPLVNANAETRYAKHGDKLFAFVGIL